MIDKHCGRCKERKSLEHFSKSKRNGFQSWCKPCKKIVSAQEYKIKPQIRKRNEVRKKDWLQWNRALKANKPCTDCGQIFHPVCMHWDHLPGYIKSGNISQMVGLAISREIILEEIAKCELVCANCHALRTHYRYNEGMS